MMNNYALNIKPIINNINREQGIKNKTVYDLINELINIRTREMDLQNNQFVQHEKTKLIYVSSGSNGVVLKELGNEELVYKITLLSNSEELYYQNFIESIYLNYFKINYPDYLNEDYFPLQNEFTEVLTYKVFRESFDFDSEIEKKLNYNFIKNDEDKIILNIMRNYNKNLSNMVYERRKFMLENFDSTVKKFLKGINFLHTNNLIHGDIKSTNILFQDNFCKLIDFGGVKRVGSINYDKTCTLTYRSPEELEYEYNLNSPKIFPNHGFRSEIWSISLVILEIIMGYNPITQIYNELLISVKENSQQEIEELIECELYRMLNSRTHLTIKRDYLIKKKLNEFISKVNILERSLNINPRNRHENIDELYLDLFGERIVKPEKTIQSDIICDLSQELKVIFNTFRKTHYPIYREILHILGKLNCLPLTMYLTDKYIIKVLEKNDPYLIDFIQQLNLNPDSDLKSDLILLFISFILISLAINDRETIMYIDLINKINETNFTHKKYTTVDIQMISNSITDICVTLEFNMVYDKYIYKTHSNVITISKEYNELMEKNY